MTSTEVLGNTAADGGGVYNDSGIIVDFTSSTIRGNHASADGGGVYGAGGDAEEFFTGSTISGNRAGARGGGIYNRSEVAANETHIIRNRAPRGGGGIYDDGADASAALTDSAVSGNTPDNCEPPGSIAGCTG